MKNLISIVLLSLLFSCNTSNTSNTTNDSTTVVSDTVQVSGSEERAARATTRDISSLLYTESQARTQYAHTPNVKKPLDTFWFNIQPNYALPIYNPVTRETESQLNEIEESIEYMMKDIINNVPARKHYSWDYFSPAGTLVGQYLYVEDRNKIIVPQLQKDIDTIYAHLNKEFGFYVFSEQKNITGYYQKATIRKNR